MPPRVEYRKAACARSQISFSDAAHAGKWKKIRRKVFLQAMELVVPWEVLLKELAAAAAARRQLVHLAQT